MTHADSTPFVEIPLTNSDLVTLVDVADLVLLPERKWRLSANGIHTQYAICTMKKRDIGMHRFIMQPPPGFQVDHIDGNGLNNRRSNLRVCTHSQNQANTRKRAGCVSRYKGVKRSGTKWVSRICVNQKFTHIGTFHTEEEAARAYDQAARHFYGEFAHVNFP